MKKNLTVLLVTLTLAMGLFAVSASAEDEYPGPRDIDIPKIDKSIVTPELP